MSVLVIIDQADGKIKKSSFEAAGYAAMTAAALHTQAEGIILGKVEDDLSLLGNYGLSRVHYAEEGAPSVHDSGACASAITAAAESCGADVIVFANNTMAKAIAPRLSVKMKAGLVTGAVALPDLTNGFTVKKSVFSGKAFAHITITTPKKIICLNPNSIKVNTSASVAEVLKIKAEGTPTGVELVNTQKLSGEISLTEADIVVSGGRGLKGPENWGMITELASLLGAATACSRPVADIHWRPHHEHVGQTGIAIAPNLYIAVGISGAIQHLAGVNRSKTIVVINKDPEAPFFKAADYGIVGDAFEVMPKIIDAVKKIKAS
jgi:electron transfer flavoprotein alpha subunit